MTALAPLPQPEDGFALLWVDQDLQLSHSEGQICLNRDDVALVDRAAPMILTGEGVWEAQFLEFGERAYIIPLEQNLFKNAVLLDGTTPLIRTIKQLWQIGHDLDQLGVVDELIAARMIDLISGLSWRILAANVNMGTSSARMAMRERAEILIAAHCCEPTFSTSALAAKMRVSPRHLSSSFAALGTTVTEAILKHRLQRAKAMLVDPESRVRQIASIALASGFIDSSYFTRRFRQVYGLTPREFRRNCDKPD